MPAYELTVRITEKDAGRKIKYFARSEMKISYSQYCAIKACNGLRVNGEPVHANYLLRTGDVVTATLPEGGGSKAVEPENLPVNIVYSDDDLLIVDKDAPLACQCTPKQDPDPANFEYDSVDVYGDVRVLHFIPLEDYNEFAETNEVLKPGEAIIYATRAPYKADELEILGSAKLRIVKQLDSFPVDGGAAMDMFSHFILVVPDFEEVLSPLSHLTNARGDTLLDVKWFYGVDMHAPDNVQVAIWRDLYSELGERLDASGCGDVGFSLESRSENRDDFYGTYGGLFFLGIALSIVFLFAAVLIIYYKQVTEGYEDQHRFGIMQKVGMTKRDIRRSINSQLLTVFFLPLIAAGVHLAFAFPMIWKLLMMFNLFNLKLLMCTTTISYLTFALFYLLVYRITSNAYYAIVSDGKAE